MAVQNSFFGRREAPESLASRLSSTPASTSASTLPTTISTTTTADVTPVAPVVASLTPTSTESSGSKLTVGPNIKLKGVEITDCDTLVVEGTVEATMDSRVMQISEHGEFKGSAEIDIAEIHGAFDGNLTVRQKLVIYATGKVTGKIRYGKLVIEEGGQLAGEILFGAVANSKAALVGKPGLQAA